MKVLINRKPVDGPWGGGNLLVKSLCNLLPQYGHEVVHHFCDNIDIIFMQDPRYSELGISINEIVAYKNKNPNVKIVHRVNECDARKGTHEMDDLLRQCSAHTDLTIFVSNWIKDYHLTRGWLCKNSEVIYNGVDVSSFKPGLKIKNRKTNIVTHHWSNNRMKGFDTYEAIDEFVMTNLGFTFTYIGRDLGTFKGTTIVPPLYGDALATELSRYDVYISGSLFDPGPNHILESLACELPTYAVKDGGGAAEFVGKDHIFDNPTDLIEILLKKDFKKNKYQPQNWQTCINKYKVLMDRLYEIHSA